MKYAFDFRTLFSIYSLYYLSTSLQELKLLLKGKSGCRKCILRIHGSTFLRYSYDGVEKIRREGKTLLSRGSQAHLLRLNYMLELLRFMHGS